MEAPVTADFEGTADKSVVVFVFKLQGIVVIDDQKNIKNIWVGCVL